MATLGQQIRDARRARRITLQQLAEAVGVDKGTASRWESGEHTPSDERLRDVERALRELGRSNARRIIASLKTPVRLVVKHG